MNGKVEPVEWLRRLVAGTDLSEAEASTLARDLMDGNWPSERLGALLAALAAKGETTDELVGFARVLRERARRFEGPREAGAVDLCGTGGAARPSYNISTVSAFVVAACGQAVAKHGNVSARGPCGSTDLLSALGLPVARSVAFAQATWREERLAFLHAPLYHASTAAVGPVRKSLGIRTIFNQLGPLTNPASVRAQVVGCFSKEYARRAGPALDRLGVERSLLVHGAGGLDELSSLGTSWGWVGASVSASRRPCEIRIPPGSLLAHSERRGSLDPRSPEEAARLAEEVLRGGGDGSVRGSVLLTSGAALWTTEEVDSLAEGVVRARQALTDGSAWAKLAALRSIAAREEWST